MTFEIPPRREGGVHTIAPHIKTFGIYTALNVFCPQAINQFANLLAILIEIPYALPGIVLAVAFILTFAAPLPVIGLSLYGTIWIILFAYFSSFLAVSLKPVMSAFLQMDPSLEEAARLAGAGFLRRMRDVLLPLIAPPPPAPPSSSSF